jgi:CheY-like chemotaxis protein
MKPIIKILYVEHGVDEKSAVRILEGSCQQLAPSLAIWTVVPDCFLALEATEHTDFDLIIVQKGLPQLDIQAVLKVIRNVGSQTPVVSMEKLASGAILEEKQAQLINSAREDGYAYALLQPYSSNSLCTCIRESLAYAEEDIVKVTNKRRADEYEEEQRQAQARRDAEETKRLRKEEREQKKSLVNALSSKTAPITARVLNTAGSAPLGGGRATTAAGKVLGRPRKNQTKPMTAAAAAKKAAAAAAAAAAGSTTTTRYPPAAAGTAPVRVRGGILQEAMVNAPRDGSKDKAAEFLSSLASLSNPVTDDTNTTDAAQFLTSLANSGVTYLDKGGQQGQQQEKRE